MNKELEQAIEKSRYMLQYKDDCYDTVVPFEPSLPEPQEPVNNQYN